jgi:hypothetical protein
MLYLLKVDVLIAAFVFAGAGLVILALVAWQEAMAYAAARHTIQKRISSLIKQPQFFASPLAISRSFSRPDERSRLTPHKIQ